MQADDVTRRMTKASALLQGHFQLSSGLHSDRYMQCARALEDPKTCAAFGSALAKVAPKGVETVLSPALGGVLIGYEVARALGVRFLFAERDASGAMTLRRGFTLKPGEKIVVVEDVVTTGKSSGEVVSLATAAGAKTLALMTIVDRSAKDTGLGLPILSLLKLPLEAWTPETCPACAKGLPVVKPGSRPQAVKK